jgi:hypothetical protein
MHHPHLFHPHLFQVLSFLLTLLASVPAARAQFTFANIADSNSPTYSGFSAPSLNNAGTLGFIAGLDAGGDGIFTSNGTTTTTIALESGPTFGNITGTITMNASGTVGFWSTLKAGGNGLFTSNGTTTTTIALSTSPIYISLGNSPSINASGQLAFWATLEGDGFNPGGEGIFRGNGTTTTTIAQTNVAGNSYKSFSTSPAMNSAGTLAFEGNFATSSETIDRLVRSNGTTTTVLAADTGTPYAAGFSAPSINTAGTVGFRASLDAGGQGLYTTNGTTTTTIALTSGLLFSSFSLTSINAAGLLAFLANLDAGGSGIFVGDGTTTTQVLKTGDALFGSTVTSLSLGREGLNDLGQLGFRYQLADGRTGVAVSNVPEPGSALLLAVAGAGLLARRRR